jgi:hypothetical protein
MKQLSAIFVALALGTTSIACAKQEEKPKQPVAAEKAAAPAKSDAAATPEKKEPEVKRVCITIKDSKTGKDVEKCRNMKIREKYEGTAIPEGKKK